MAEKSEGPAGGHRRLGRGIGALLSVPVRVPADPKVRSGTPANPPSTPSIQAEQPPPPSTAPAVGVQSRQDSGQASEIDAVPRGTAASSPLVSVPTAEVIPNPRQPRKDFDDSTIKALAESIRSAGLMQPIVVRLNPSVAGGKYELIAGERRWRAAKLLGLTQIPALVRDVSDQLAAEWALIENIQREDLNPIDRSEALQRLVDEFALTHQELAGRLGMDRVTITNLLRLGDLDPFTRDAVRRGALSQGHAKVLLGVTQLELRKSLASAAISGDLSVRELERRVRESTPSGNKPASPEISLPRKPHIADLERRLAEHLGTKVSINEDGKKKGSGTLVINYYSFDQFEGLMRKMGFSTES
jgi:ParB family chromosome partitioning protein